jgi:amino acid adenylation domain-containing protein
LTSKMGSTMGRSESEGIDGILARQGAQNGGLIAIFDNEGAITYSELDYRTRCAAAWVRGNELVGRPVVLRMQRTKQFVVAMLGLLRGGAVCVPLDVEDPPARTAAVMDRFESAVLVTDVEERDLYPSHHQNPPAARTAIESASLFMESNLEQSPLILEKLRSEQPAFIFFTSGSLGKPKGVVLSHQAVLAGQRWLHATFGGSPGDCFLFRAPLGVTNVIREAIWPILAGARSYVLAPGLHRDPEAHINAVTRHDVVTLVVTPNLLDSAMNHSSFREMVSLRQIIVTSDICHPALVVNYRKQALGARLYNIYGLTEALYGSYCDLTTLFLGGADLVPIGRSAELDVAIRNADGSPVRLGEPGELFLSGQGIADCYYKDPKATSAHFSSIGAKRVFRTGDLARQAEDGLFYLLGRRDLQLKVRGHRIETEEIETAILDVSSLQKVAVIQHNFENGNKLVAFYESPDSIDVAALRRKLADRLSLHAIPSLFLRRNSLPLTTSGKVDRRSLGQENLSFEDFGDMSITAPETGEQYALLNIWKDYLRVERIGIDTDFFEFGGDSILAMLITAKAKELGFFLTVADFFRCRTVRGLCISAAPAPVPENKTTREDESDLGAQQEAMSLMQKYCGPAKVERSFAASPMEVGMLFHTVLEPASGVYYEQLTHLISGPLDVDVLRQAWNAVFTRSSMLRSSFLWGHGGLPRQVVLSHVTPRWEVRDLSAVHEHAIYAELDCALSAYRTEGFDVRVAPLVRFLLIRMGPDRWLFTVNYHHILLDAWSFYLVMKSAFSAYQELIEGTPQTMAFEDTFHDYVRALCRIDPSAAREFWRSYLAEYRAPYHISGAHPNVTGHGDYRVTLSSTLTRAIRTRARRGGVTVNTVFLGAWFALLGALSGRRVVTTGMIVTLRPPLIGNIGKVVGVCVNTIPVKTELRNNEDQSDFVQRIFREQEELRRFEMLEIAEIQSLSLLPAGSPLFDSLLIFENFQVDSQLSIRTGNLKVECIRYDGWTNYPLSLTINNVSDMSGLIDGNFVGDAVNPERIVVRFKNDRRFFSDIDAQDLSAALTSALEFFTETEMPMAEVQQKIRAASRYLVPHVAGPALAPKAPEIPPPSAEVEPALKSAILAEFSALLGYQVSPDDNFFQHGGSSFKALRLVGRLAEKFDSSIPLEFFFKYPTASAMAELISQSA